MAEHDSIRRSLPWQRWINVLVVMGIVLVLLAVFIPAVQNARNAARLTQSRNHLKQQGLAFHNYHDVYSCFPLGASTNSRGDAMHGCITRCLPYLESLALYSMLAMELPANESLFRYTGYAVFRMPSIDAMRTSEGYWLTHYMANPNVCHRNSSISISQMTSKTSNNWLFGEVSGNHQPLGYPFNWRPLSLPFNKGDNSYGRPTGEGTQICLADGSVRFLANTIAAKVVASLTNAPPVAVDEATSVPVRQFLIGDFVEP